jgi:DNA-binding CsgD family transcriptional regulator
MGEIRAGWTLVTTRLRTPHLIGREDALGELHASTADVVGGRGSLVLVAGEVGIGKTRLVDEYAARVTGLLVLRGGCVSDVPYAPWTELLWWFAHNVDTFEIDALPVSVRAQLARLIPEFAAPGAEATTDDSGQHLLFEAVVHLLAHAARHAPLVVFVDDIHWIDPASRELLLYVANNLRRLPIVLVVAYRVEEAAADRDLIARLARLSTHRVTLGPLRNEQAAEMAGELLGAGADVGDLDRIARDAEGNPLFVEELVAAHGTSRIPDTLRDLMLVRFSSLGEEAQSLVRVAAVMGPRAPRSWLAGACGWDDARLRATTRAAVEAGVLVATDDGRDYEFRHALLRQAVLEETLPDERVSLHRAIARALVDRPESGVGIDRIAELATHWDAASEPREALRWQTAAALHAQENYAFEAALRAYERALIWWDLVPDAKEVAELDHASVLLNAADAAGFAGHIERAANLARLGLEEANHDDVKRGVDAAGRVYSHFWAADRAPEFFDYANANVIPVLDQVDAPTRARFLVSQVEHLVGYAAPSEIREPATHMMQALDDISDPVLEARAHMVNAWCHGAYGELDRVEEEYARAAQIAAGAEAHSILALVLYNHASFKTSIPDLDGCLELLDAGDALVEQFGLRRYRVPACHLRALACSLRGDLDDARSAIAPLDGIETHGFDAWARADGRAFIDMMAGEYASVIDGLDPVAVGAPLPHDSELIIDIAALRVTAFSWLGELDRAREAADDGGAAIARHQEVHLHGRLAMAGVRVEADAAVAATGAADVNEIERAQDRANAIVAAWEQAIAGLDFKSPLVRAFSSAVAAEMARLHAENVAERSALAADAFDAISLPYYATYFRWREAEAMLNNSERVAATEVLKRTRSSAHAHGFAGLETVVTALARGYQLRLGPAGRTVDGDEPLSERELEVLRLLVVGKNNPEIAAALFISRRTAAAHVSNIMRKLDASSRVEAVAEAYRRLLV